MSVQPYLRTVAAQGRETEVIGPFHAHFNPASAGEGSNYAIPADGTEPTDADVAALVAAFERRDRRPRLEFLPATSPTCEAVLERAGFEIELRTVVMTCRPGELVVPPPTPGLTLHVVGPDADDDTLTATLAVQAAAFGDAGVTPERIALARRWLDRWTTVLARVDGEPAGVGMSLDVHGATTELVGIATSAAFRRRGVAGAVTAELTRRVHARGAECVFLTPGDAGAGRVYARAGFTAADEMLHIRR